jgi:hypothetical protein
MSFVIGVLFSDLMKLQKQLILLACQHLGPLVSCGPSVCNIDVDIPNLSQHAFLSWFLLLSPSGTVKC